MDFLSGRAESTHLEVASFANTPVVTAATAAEAERLQQTKGF
jgi:hypothetical protein